MLVHKALLLRFFLEFSGTHFISTPSVGTIFIFAKSVASVQMAIFTKIFDALSHIRFGYA